MDERVNSQHRREKQVLFVKTIQHFDVKNLIHLINEAEQLKLAGIVKKAFVLDNLKYMNMTDGCDKIHNYHIIKPLLSDVIDTIIANSNTLSVNRYDDSCCDIV
jgi:hypothetical protein